MKALSELESNCRRGVRIHADQREALKVDLSESSLCTTRSASGAKRGCQERARDVSLGSSGPAARISSSTSLGGTTRP